VQATIFMQKLDLNCSFSLLSNATDYNAKMESIKKASMKQQVEQAVLSIAKRMKQVLKRERYS